METLVRLALGAIVAVAAPAGAGAAEPWPAKPIRIVVTFPPGGQTDVVARLIQPHLEARLGQPVVVENRPGAGGTIGVDAVAKAAPDGHFIGVGPMGALTVNMSLQEKMPYDTLKDLAPISLLTSTPFVLAAPLSFAASHVGEVIALAKTDAGNLSIGHGGNGSAMHLTALLFNHMAGVNIALVPYRGSGPALNDVVAGHIPLAVGDTTSALGVLRTGKVKALGVSSLRRDVTAGRSDLRRIRLARFRIHGLVRHVGAGRHTARDHRDTERRDRQRAQRPCDRRAAAGDRRRSGSQHAGRVRPIHPPRDRQVGEGDGAVRVQGELIDRPDRSVETYG